MSQKFLLDTNLLVKAFDSGSATTPEERQAAKQKLAELLKQSSSAFAITPLIRYELLRHVAWGDHERYQKLEAIISKFTMIDITWEISDLATGLFQLDTHESKVAKSGKNVDKRKFDAFHLACAKYRGLKLASDDSDIAKLEPLYTRLMEARGNIAQEDDTNSEENK